VLFNIGPRRGTFSGAAAGLSVLLFGALLANAAIYADFPLAYVALLAAGLLADALVHAIGRRRGNAGVPWISTALLSAIPVLIAIGLALKAAQGAGGFKSSDTRQTV
jgi:hypothetical protein